MLQPVYELVKFCETEINENSERQMIRADKQDCILWHVLYTSLCTDFLVLLKIFTGSQKVVWESSRYMTSKKGRLPGVWKNLYLKILQWAWVMLITLKLELFLVCRCPGNLHTVEPQLLNDLLQGGDARRTWEMLITWTNLKWLLMFPITKQSQLITKPLFQALTALVQLRFT